ncbi:hypothetical protein [Acidithiobacillus caldus]|uniref:hypothetical protein n=1 Tax=Acidithiobacillus caldus TaxID=33059 RepID=UPI0011D2ACC2|nr:hypothetical protein [Acidithiobacillus caldus]
MNSFFVINKSFQKTPENFGLERCAAIEVECLYYPGEKYATTIPGGHVTDLDAVCANIAIYEEATKTGIFPKPSVQADYVDAMARLCADHYSKISMVAINPDGSISVKATAGARRLSIDILGFHEYAVAIFEKVDRYKYRTVFRSKRKIGQSEMLSKIEDVRAGAVTAIELIPRKDHSSPNLTSYGDLS